MKVLITGNLPEHILDMIRKEHSVEVNSENRPLERSELLAKIREINGLLCMLTDRVDEPLLNAAPGLKMIANCAVGFDNIDLPAATKRNIPVTNTPGVLTDATADLAFALILATGRRLTEGDRMVREDRFKCFIPLAFLGREVSGSVLGILGLGRIGKAVAKRAAGFDMKVIYFNRTRLAPEEEKVLGVDYVDFQTLLKISDYISIHTPLTPETLHLLGEKQLKMMKPTACLINTSRGPVVDEAALVSALKNRIIRSAGLDVYEHEPRLAPGLKELENVILLPHVGSATIETRTRMAQTAAKNLMAGLKGEVPPNCLNRDRISLPHEG